MLPKPCIEVTILKTLQITRNDLKLLSNSTEAYGMNHEISLTGSKVCVAWKSALFALSDNICSQGKALTVLHDWGSQ
jgi:hypothetical protein